MRNTILTGILLIAGCAAVEKANTVWTITDMANEVITEIEKKEEKIPIDAYP